MASFAVTRSVLATVALSCVLAATFAAATTRSVSDLSVDTSARGIRNCAFDISVVPPRFKYCTRNVPFHCYGSSVCFPPNGQASAHPCLRAKYGNAAMGRLRWCTNRTPISHYRNGLACSTARDMTAFFRCFNDGK